ncbi:chromosome segregation protein SMC [Eubacterium oxidoreducens]|uniref:Chromosome partition protein Smc n=1 Tax=Eubacterium oxidoreducens TaxID=1732 RepID=A0A1G6BH70_EUBOX|nr:chromosome segregation protein SMC [Eubacterium oxidoreducens]SDB19947.1 condensin subunit Smc [Eubacterium oxidoreducens]
MYLKKIEIQGFKSFANKIKLDFHDGITGIVGPNGSGKSNIGDAVRWVLGEQRAKQLRGASMQDVIFAGTENRKPLSYASVSITLDNTDHSLAIDFEEVTVTRRVYRSGESEYLINGMPCRLKDIHELFYDTGIGKEGYSIIGQGQIDRILSGKPEERRELFDEAAGIVKFKRRKATAQKKLEKEHENLLRVVDILTEQERQIGPLKRQSETARIYLTKKEQLKEIDVNMFLLELQEIQRNMEKTETLLTNSGKEYEQTKDSYENTKQEYEKMQLAIEQMDQEINETRESINEIGLSKGRQAGNINVLKEQIRSLEASKEQFQTRIENVQRRIDDKAEEKKKFDQEKEQIVQELEQAKGSVAAANDELLKVQNVIEELSGRVEEKKSFIIRLLNQKASIQADQQRHATMKEQVNIRKAQMTTGLLTHKGEEQSLSESCAQAEKIYDEITGKLTKQKNELQKTEKMREQQKKDLAAAHGEREQLNGEKQKITSRLEALRNIAERYEGYGNSIKRVMEQKDSNKGIHGVVADLISVDKKYETAIETALGGNIQNIVTEDEKTAKQMISYLKEHRYGRATFLPLTSVGKEAEDRSDKPYLKEEGAIGLASSLVKAKDIYDGVVKHLLGRIVIVDTVDHALSLAKKYSYTLHIVTLEGEYLRPGGSISGGAFKNNSNLLGRNREIELLTKKLEELEKKSKEVKERLDNLVVARDLLKEDLSVMNEEVQKLSIEQHEALLDRDSLRTQMTEAKEAYEQLQKEQKDIDEQLAQIKRDSEVAALKMQEVMDSEEKTNAEIAEAEKQMEEHSKILEEKQQVVSQLSLAEASVKQRVEFVDQNIDRTVREAASLNEDKYKIEKENKESDSRMEEKRLLIAEKEKEIAGSDVTAQQLNDKLVDSMKKKDKMIADNKGFFEKREQLSEHMNALDKELYRLNSMKERLEETQEKRIAYMWAEYELTMHSAKELRNEELNDLSSMKSQAVQLKSDIRALGNVNVNAIEDYKELSERYEFLLGQKNDLTQSEENLQRIIEELDSGMRKQFSEKFVEIQREFDKAFKLLFGGGKGTLELLEGEDLLETGISIVAQPPGKKLQNMMQLSGGEKALTAIALLFAIQNLKPSPFCLLDEIEAALDDSNVGRFAEYLHKLTKNTQFIVITHRRGTMAAADRLYGITMQEKGVSTLVSVNLIENDLDN